MTHLSPIGNSLGLRIPKAILQQVGFKKETDLVFKVTNEGLLIAPAHQTRQGWKEAFDGSGTQSQEKPLIGDDLRNDFDRDEWKW